MSPEPKALNTLNRPNSDSWVAKLQGTGSVNHAVVVDGNGIGGSVRICDPRDPTMYTMSREDFLSYWTGVW